MILKFGLPQWADVFRPPHMNDRLSVHVQQRRKLGATRRHDGRSIITRTSRDSVFEEEWAVKTAGISLPQV